MQKIRNVIAKGKIKPYTYSIDVKLGSRKMCCLMVVI